MNMKVIFYNQEIIINLPIVSYVVENLPLHIIFKFDGTNPGSSVGRTSASGLEDPFLFQGRGRP